MDHLVIRIQIQKKSSIFVRVQKISNRLLANKLVILYLT